MIAAALTALFFSFSIVFGARSATLVGPRWANLGRIALATLFLGGWAHLAGAGLAGPGQPWFFLSGVIGFGLGDLALFGALTRIGPRLSILLTQCLAAPIATLVEWGWLDTTLRPLDLGCAALILAGVAIALAPDHGTAVPRRVFWIGVLCGAGSALGQALGAVLSRKASALNALAHSPVDGGTAAYQRALGGLLLTVLVLALLQVRRSATPSLPAPQWRAGWPFVLGNALAGPAIGVGCYQWALKTTPSGLVLPIVATSPLLTILLSWQIDGICPSRRAVAGGALAVAGAAALAFAQSHQ